MVRYLVKYGVPAMPCGLAYVIPNECKEIIEALNRVFDVGACSDGIKPFYRHETSEETDVSNPQLGCNGSSNCDVGIRISSGRGGGMGG